MTDDKQDMTGLDGDFACARAAQPAPSEALMLRIIEDAAREQAARIAPPAAPPRRGRWCLALADLGGWPAMAGLAMAAVAGMWLGALPPAQVRPLLALLLGGPQEGVLMDTSAEYALGLDEGGL